MIEAPEVIRGPERLQRRLRTSATVFLLILGMGELPALAAEGKIRIVSRVPPQIAPDTAVARFKLRWLAVASVLHLSFGAAI